MRVKVQELSGGLDEPDGAGTAAASSKYARTQSRSAPGAGGEIPQQRALVAKVRPQALGDGEHHLPVRHLLEQLIDGPLGPDQLALHVAGWALCRYRHNGHRHLSLQENL